MKRGIGKTRCKPMRNLAKIQMSPKRFRPPPHLKISLTAIGNHIGQLEQKYRHQGLSETTRAGLKLKIQLRAEFCHPSRDIKFAGTR